MTTAKKKSKTFIIVIFPYLFIRDGLEIDGLNIKPSITEIIKDEVPEIQDQLLLVAKFFRAGKNDDSIQKWSYLVEELPDAREFDDLKQKLDKLTTLLRYDDLSNLRMDPKFSNYNYFVFQITPRNIQNIGKQVNYYQGLLNGEAPIPFPVYDNKIKTPYRLSSPVYPQTLENIKSIKLIVQFYQLSPYYFSDVEHNKMLKSMYWFNHSFIDSAETDFGMSVINMQTALEALLKISDKSMRTERKKIQIASGLINILGESNELLDWINNFWTLRNSLVHGDIEKPSFMYKASKRTKGHRQHLLLARQFFSKALESKLKLRTAISTRSIMRQLQSNKVRLKKAKEILENSTPDEEDIFIAYDLIEDLLNDDISADKQTTKVFGKLLIGLVINNIEDKDNNSELLEAFDNIVKWPGKDFSKLAVLYEKAQKPYDGFYFQQTTGIELEQLKLFTAMHTFLGFAVWRLIYFWD